MQSAGSAHSLGSVADQGDQQDNRDRGADITRRRERLGLSPTKFARMSAGAVYRSTLIDAEAGLEKVRPSTYAAIEHVLDEMEASGMEPDEEENHSGVVRIEVKGVYGAESLVVEGPVENIPELEQLVDRIMRRRAHAADENADS